jgi:hydroxymethylglutaryl-CoA lyase
MLQGMGLKTDIDLEKLVQASQSIAAALGRALPSRYLQAHLAQDLRKS